MEGTRWARMPTLLLPGHHSLLLNATADASCTYHESAREFFFLLRHTYYFFWYYFSVAVRHGLYHVHFSV